MQHDATSPGQVAGGVGGEGCQPARATTVPQGDVVVVVRRAAKDTVKATLGRPLRSRNRKIFAAPRARLARMLPDDPLRARLRRGLLDRGRVLATLLAEVLAGKRIDVKLGALGILGKPGMRPEEKLRLALDQVEARRRLLDAGDDRFGRCDDCGEELGELALAEMPWADRCRAHAARPGS